MSAPEPNRPPPDPAEVTAPGDREIRIERVFHAPRERVWRAMTDPALVAQWWGRGDRVVIERMEVERGGLGDSSSTATTARGASRAAIAR